MGILGDVELAAPGDGKLRVESVAWVEQEIGAELPDDVLVLLAIGDPVARIATGLASLESLLDVSETVLEIDDEEHAGRWIAIARVGSEPFAELMTGAPSAHELLLCIPETRGKSVLVVSGRRPRETTSLGAFIDDAVRGELRHLEKWPEVLDEARERADAPEAVMVEDGVDERKEPPRVRHERFGRGDVIETHEDKLLVRFDDGVTRKLLARFLAEA